MKSMHREKGKKETNKQSSEALPEKIIRRNSETVYRLAYSLVRTRADADDIYQEVFLRYVRKAPAFDSEEHEKAWFIRVTINCCKNLWKSPWMQRRSALENDVLEREASYEGAWETGDEDQLLIETVRQLPEKYRVVIHLFYYEELSVEEIGRITRSKASTVRTRLTRARRELKSLLEEEGGGLHVSGQI
ncbi:MAG: sigma-70 family RNA polymerase sigma factor [Lachnospiraceae bacterium]|nr:sigma-70 family RNA polymerase sigma factor [Lachnospiraceae bacterium]MDE7273521.1 sigma-70 family RNA polymerase sigma factor [Lachnospiraceae bacterium]